MPLQTSPISADTDGMQRLLATVAAVAAALTLAGPAVAAGSSSVAALQVALRAHGRYVAVVDGVQGPLTESALASFQRSKGLTSTGSVGPATRSALGSLGRPLLGQRELSVGAVGWDVSALEFRLTRFGLVQKAVDGRFTAATARALQRFQAARGLTADGIAGKLTYKALARPGVATAAFAPPTAPTHVVVAGESFSSIATRYDISPLLLAQGNGLELSAIIVPGQRLVLPAAVTVRVPRSVAVPGQEASPADVRASIDHWAAVYGVDPELARATAWMESGFQQNVISNVGAVGVMQLLPATWAWVDDALLGTKTPRTYDGNIRAGVRYLRWLLDQFAGNSRLALAAYYQGPKAVRDRGLFDDTRRYVSIILKLHGSV